MNLLKQSKERCYQSLISFVRERLGQAVSLYGTGDESKKTAILSPGKFGTIGHKDKNMWSENKGKKITWLSPGQFGENETYLS